MAGEVVTPPRRSCSPPLASTPSTLMSSNSWPRVDFHMAARAVIEAYVPPAPIRIKKSKRPRLTTSKEDKEGEDDDDDDEDEEDDEENDDDEDDDEDDEHDDDENEEDDAIRQRLDSSIAGPTLPLRSEHYSNSHPLKKSSTTTAATAKATEKDAAVDEEVISLTVDEPQRRRKSQSKNSLDDNESELSEPDSNVHSPLADVLNDLPIVVSVDTHNSQKASPLPLDSDLEDENMGDAQDQAPASHYPKRKRTSTFANLNENKLEVAPAGRTGSAVSQGLKTRTSRQSLGSVKGVLLGQWRDSQVPDPENRHAVIGFIDVRDRLRTRIERTDLDGKPVSTDYPLPPGPGGSWVTFERIIFSKHLIGLDHLQIKEYVRLRADATDRSADERRVAETAAVKEAIRRAKENHVVDNTTSQPTIAHGADLPEAISNPGGPDAKRRRVSGAFAAVSKPNAGSDVPEPSATPATHPPLQPRPTTGLSVHDPLPGTRPTRILLGYWAGSSEPVAEDRHAVYGILGQNDMFRVKVVRETRDGRFVGGNFPTGAGALWIQYEEVEFDPHLKPLSRSEVKEYCRVRQYQIDHGEAPDERAANEHKAVSEAQARIAAGFKHPHQSVATNHTPATMPGTETAEPSNDKGETDSGVRQSKRNEGREPRENREIRTQQRPSRISLNEAEIRTTRRAQNEGDTRSSESRSSSRAQVDNRERASALARREIARAEAAQGRADRNAQHRERAAAMVADATSHSLSAPATNGRTRLHDSEDMQRLNKIWAQQEISRMKAGAEDAKIYDGIKYERKATGPFTGKLVSQGTIINIDGQDYVEYRVLTKPSFF